MDVEEIVVFVTVASVQDGRTIGRGLVEQQLVACVNLVPHITSIFRWEGKVAEEQECLIIMKTRKDLYAKLEGAVKEVHEYAVPEIIALPITNGLPEYLNWVKSATQGVK